MLLKALILRFYDYIYLFLLIGFLQFYGVDVFAK